MTFKGPLTTSLKALQRMAPKRTFYGPFWGSLFESPFEGRLKVPPSCEGPLKNLWSL